MNRFFTTDDVKKTKIAGMELPVEWWSRPYEYAWALQYANSKDDVVLDAGCGIEHPFKYELAKKCKVVHAVDSDERIETLTGSKTLEFHKMYLENIRHKFPPKSFDRIFCISVLEHMVDKVDEILAGFYEVLTDDGLLILTVDYPFLTPEHLGMKALGAGFTFAGAVEYENVDDEKTIKGQYHGLKCYSAVLRKAVVIHDTKIDEPSETK